VCIDPYLLRPIDPGTQATAITSRKTAVLQRPAGAGAGVVHRRLQRPRCTAGQGQLQCGYVAVPAVILLPDAGAGGQGAGVAGCLHIHARILAGANGFDLNLVDGGGTGVDSAQTQGQRAVITGVCGQGAGEFQRGRLESGVAEIASAEVGSQRRGARHAADLNASA